MVSGVSVSMPEKALGEGLVEAVDQALVLDEDGAGEVVEGGGVLGGEAGGERLVQRQPFAQGDRQALLPQRLEERREHRGLRRRSG